MKRNPKLLLTPKGAAVLFLALACLARADQMVEPKPYILYLGADLSIQRDGGLFPVHGVKGKSFVIEKDGKEVHVPIGGNTALHETLKLTEASASVAGLQYKQIYTPENDPDLDLQHSASMSVAVISNGDQNLTGNPSASGTNMQNVVKNSAPGSSMSSTTAANSGEGMAAIATVAQQIASGSNGFDTNHSAGPAEGAYDAIDLSFEVSADHSLTDPYSIIVVEYHDPNGKQGAEFNWIHAERLDPVSSNPEKVHFSGAGFAKGYQIEGVQVHIYDRGQEVATNASPRRMALTRDQAFMYMTFDYVGRHKGATLPAAPAPQTLTDGFRSRVPEALLTQTVYVKVSKDGNAGESFLDADCTRKVEDPALGSALKEIHFNPALANGAPVDGVAVLRFDQLAM